MKVKKKVYCEDCGKPIHYTAIRCQSCNRRGSRNCNWQGGLSFEPYPPDFNQQLKDKIRVRDNFICQKCGVPELECDRKLDVHHIDYNKLNCENSNLVSLCSRCNAVVNINRDHWTNYFMEKTGQFA